MDFTPDAPQAAIQQIAREFARNTLAALAPVIEAEHRFPQDVLLRLAGKGLMGVNIASEFGGAAAGVVAYSLAVTEIARVDPAVAVTMCVNNMVAEVIQEFGDEAQQRAHIPKITSGEYAAGSFCLSEPGSGSDAAAMETRAVPNEDTYVINGTKAWITSGAHAGVFIVWAKVGSAGERDSISALLVDPQTPGISIGKAENKMGQHASNTVSLSFDDVIVPKSALLGQIGQGFPIAMMALDGGRIGIGSQALGIAKEALSILRKFDPNCADSAEFSARVRAAETLVLRAAWLKEQKTRAFSKEASMAKLYASETACSVCEAAITNIGFEATLPTRRVEKLLRDGRVTRIYEGTSEVQRIVISREIMKAGV